MGDDKPTKLAKNAAASKNTEKPAGPEPKEPMAKKPPTPDEATAANSAAEGNGGAPNVANVAELKPALNVSIGSDGKVEGEGEQPLKKRQIAATPMTAVSLKDWNKEDSNKFAIPSFASFSFIPSFGPLKIVQLPIFLQSLYCTLAIVQPKLRSSITLLLVPLIDFNSRYTNSMMVGVVMMKMQPHKADKTKATTELRLADSTGVIVVKVTDTAKVAEMHSVTLGQVKRNPLYTIQ